MRWAADRNLRIVVKGTGHDLNGRSVPLFGLLPTIVTDSLLGRAVLMHFPSGPVISVDLNETPPGKSLAEQTPLKMSL